MRTNSNIRKRSIGQTLLIIGWLVLFVSGCRGIRVEEVSTVSKSDWRQDGGNYSRDRTTSAVLPLPLKLDWRYNAAGAFGAGSPLFFGNTLLVGTRRGDMYAINIEKGRKKGSKRFAEAIEGALVTDGDIVFIPAALGKYNLMAYNLRTGKHLWRNKGIPFETGLVIAADVIVGTDISGKVTAVDRFTGVELWSFELPDLESTYSAPLLLPSGDIVITGEHGSLIRLDAQDGQLIWQTSIPTPIRVSPAIADESLIVSGARGVLFSIDLATGKSIWESRMGSAEVRLASPAASGGKIYLGTSEGKLFEIEASSGVINWNFNGPDVFAAPPLVTDTHIFIGSMGRVLYAFNRETSILDWEFKLDGRIKSAMAARNGELFVLAEPRHVYKFIPAQRGQQNAD